MARAKGTSKPRTTRSPRTRRPPQGPSTAAPLDEIRKAEDAARIADRRHKVWRAKVNGASITAIMQALAQEGIEASRGTVWNDLEAEMAEVRSETKNLVEDFRSLHIERLERLTLALFPLATGNGNTPPDLHAVDRMLAVMTRQARLIGLDTQAAPSGGDAGDAFHQFLMAADERYKAQQAPAKGLEPATIDVTPVTPDAANAP